MTRRLELTKRAAVAVAMASTAVLAPMLSPLTGATAHAADLTPTQVSQLAEKGAFEELLTQLQAGAAAREGAEVGDLITDLERFQRNEQTRQAERQQAYAAALQKVNADLTADRVEDALVAAIDAHGLAGNKQDVLESPSVIRLIKAAQERASAAEDKGDWVEAGTIYRLLNLLDEDNRPFQEQADTAAGHVRLLQLYAPKRLQELYQQRADRLAKEKGEEQPEELNFEMEDWTRRLHDVEPAMLRQTLMQAARLHVDKNDSGGYRQLMEGALQNLLLLVDNEAVTDTFPSMRNAKLRQDFHDFLQREKVRLDAPDAALGFLDTASMIDKVIDMNQRTIGLPEKVVVYEMTEGAMGELDDFSSVIWPDDVPAFLRTTQGEFKGVGIQISRRDGELIVVSPLEDTPAYRAGIKANDVISEVDGVSTANWSLTKAVDRITGEAGTKVRLTITRKGEEEPLDFVITRAPIPIQSVRGWQHKQQGGWDFWIDPQDRIGYVRLSAFLPQSVEDLDAAVSEMQESGPINGLILDLRFNPGGLLSSAVDIVDRFVSNGPVVFTVDGNGTRTHESKAHRHNTYPQFPVAVLINQGSASASEIVSGALQDYGRATIIGQRSFGKGSVQDLYPLSRGRAYLKLTTQYYQLPLGRIIHRTEGKEDWGIHPDLLVDMTDQQVRDAIELRQQSDVLLDDGERLQDREGKFVDQPLATEILERAVDPQLETALLVIKAQRLARDLAMAQAGEAPINAN